MTISAALSNQNAIAPRRSLWRRMVSSTLLTLTVILSSLLILHTPPALASLTDDKFDGNIFALYAGNGSLVPPKVTLAESFQRKKPVLLVFYLDDSSDCKKYVAVIDRLQEFYGREADFIPLSVDSLPYKPSTSLTDPSHYYEGVVPQTLIIDQSGQIAFNAKGQVPFEQIDDVFRKVFDLLPRSESVELKRRAVNEINTELTR